MNITITPENQSVVSALIRACSVAHQLEMQGLDVLSVMAFPGKPCIHIERNDICNIWIRDGIASYQFFNGSKGKQGVFERLGCRVYWIESLY